MNYLRYIKEYILVLLIGVSIPFSTIGQKISVAIIKDHCSPAELQAIQHLLLDNEKLSLQPLLVSELTPDKIKNIDALWYHRTDTLPFTNSELEAGTVIKQFVANGGSLFLSMEAFPLINKWGIEPVSPSLQQDTVVDEGFGRPLGFHSFKDHPVFDGLLGGVYTSKQKENHVVRKHGYFNTSLPRLGKVIGIQWTYIRFWENNKLLLEYNWGKGKIITAGAYLYFDAVNYQQLHLKKFIENVFSYMKGISKQERKYFWSYEKTPPKLHQFQTNIVEPIPAKEWKLPIPTLAIQQKQATNDFFDLVGRRILWMGKINSGVEEIWVHPFMALRDFEAGVKIKGTDSITWLKNITPIATVSPEFLVRSYTIANSTIKEVQTVSFDRPIGVVHFEIEGKDVVELVAQYACNLRYMWPYDADATGTISYQYNKGINGHIISGQGGELNTVVMYSQTPVSQSINTQPSLNGIHVSCEFDTRNARFINFYISGNTNNYNDAIGQLTNNRNELDTLFNISNTYYQTLLKNHLIIETPDTHFNDGYKWALARTDQFLQTTPSIGTSLMAGFGTTARGWNGRHPISGRPGYAWYFGRDAIWSAMAINAYGGFTMVKEILKSFSRYQDINGKIYHELTSSGVAHYDASDATPLYIILAGHYLRYSGDTTYIKVLWPSLKKALDYCKSTDTDGDGLIENTNVGHGWIEGGPLFGTHTEFYLAGCWAATLDAAAYICKNLNMPAESDAYNKQSNLVKSIIDKDFWNPSQQFFYNGKMIDGSYMPEATVLATVPIYFNAVIDSKKISKVNSRLSSKYFSTDWGIRMIEDSSRKYNAGSYHSGMVWPLYGGWAALSEFKSGHNVSGYKHIISNLHVYQNWAPGSIEETLNGDMYKPNGVCHHQCWSETMVLQPAIEGMLGLYTDALTRQLKLSPYFPWDWDHATIKNIKMGSGVTNMMMKRKSGVTIFDFTCSEDINIIFEPKFPFATQIQEVLLDGKSVYYTISSLAEGIKLNIDHALKKGKHSIIIKHKGGIGFLPNITIPQPGSDSKGVQLLNEKISNNVYSLTLQALPDTVYQVEIFSAVRPKSIKGAQIITKTKTGYRIAVTMPSSTSKYAIKEVAISF